MDQCQEPAVASEPSEYQLVPILKRQVGLLPSTVQKNRAIISAQIEREKRVAIARGQARAKSVAPIEFRGPSPMVPLIRIGTEALDAVNTTFVKSLWDAGGQDESPIGKSQSYFGSKSC